MRKLEHYSFPLTSPTKCFKSIAFILSKVIILTLFYNCNFYLILSYELWATMECSLLLVGFLTTSFFSELFRFTVWLAKLIVKWFFWRELLILHPWCLSVGCCCCCLTQWQMPIYCIKYKREMLSRYHRVQGNDSSVSPNVLLVIYWFWSCLFLLSECCRYYFLVFRLSVAQENSEALPLGELIGSSKLTRPKLNPPKLFLHQGFLVPSLESLFSTTRLSRPSPWSHHFSWTSLSVLQQKRWVYLQNISIILTAYFFHWFCPHINH